jgi:alcohol dehydrogenase, propanol-preferring
MSAWAVVRNKEPLQRFEQAPLEPTGTEVVLQVTHAGVCHSDLHFWKGYYDMGGGQHMLLADRGVVLPRAPGHEIVARVIKLGPLASGVKVGDVRIVFPWLGCGGCERCLAGDDNLCNQPKALGVLQDGGYGDQVKVPNSKFLVDCSGIDPAYAATLACSGITVYSAIRKLMPMRPEEPVVLFGAGGLGLAAIAMWRALDHQHIISVDISADKRAAALEMGATQVIDGTAADLVNRITEAAGGPVKAAMDFVNIGSTAQAGLECLAKNGQLILVGVGGGQLTLSLAGLIFRPRGIQGSLTGNPQDLREVAELARSGKLRPIPVSVMPKHQINDALMQLLEGRATGRIVLVDEADSGASRPPLLPGS